jgi:signal transduction histidine kinase
VKDRVKDFRRVRAGDLKVNSRNWRRHPTAQREALAGLLSEIGYADALLARELRDGSLELVDGHLRAELTPDEMVPVLVLDLTKKEADKLLATLDPLAAMAERDEKKLGKLLSEITTESEALQSLLDDLAGRAAEKAVELKQLPLQRPPVLSWVLIGIPTIRFGEIAGAVQSIAAVEGTILETTITDEVKQDG